MDLVIAVPIGFVLGFLIALTGVGGGAVVAPAIYVILGRDYGESVALSLVYSLFTKVMSAIQHWRHGSVRWRITLLYGLAGIPGAVAGARLVYWASPEIQRAFPFVMGGVLLMVSALMLMETGVRAIAAWEKPFSPDDLTWPLGAAVGVYQSAVGVLMGVTSIGSGSLVILSMVYLFRMSAREIVGSNIVIALIMVVPAGLTHYLAGGVDWTLLAVLLVGSAAGTALGSRATLVLPDRAIKLAIVVLVVVGAVSTMVKAW
jgi:uncharacterized membrane protein YfcA